MTENEAIKILKSPTKYTRVRDDDVILSSDFAKAYEKAIQALEKQIPKKPLYNGANWYRCPNGCEVHKKQFERDFYCPMCGQALLWEGVKNDGE